MNTNLNTTTIFQGVTAAAIALAMTWVLSWSLVDSTRVARWVSVADVAATAAHAAAGSSTLAGSFKVGLLQ